METGRSSAPVEFPHIAQQFTFRIYWFVIRTVFFDVGYTLVFPDPDVLLEPLHQLGVAVPESHLRAAEIWTKQQMDTAWRQRGPAPRFWSLFHDHLLRSTGITDKSLHAELVGIANTSAIWRHVPPGTTNVLSCLRRRYSLGIISNSDGTLSALLERLGLLAYFSVVIDSGLVAYEKPDRRLFLAAVKGSEAQCRESLHVGDIYSADYVGAKAAGMSAILLDRCGAYCRLDVPRVESLAELEASLDDEHG